MSPAGARFRGGPRDEHWLDRPAASARQYEPRQRRLRAGADLGGFNTNTARGSGAGADAGDHPIELGLDRGEQWLTRIASDAAYQRLFSDAFGDQRPISVDNLVKAIATFERTIVSARSPYDRYHFDRDDSAVSDAAKRGEVLFHSRPLSCFTCHGGVHFSGAMGTARRQMPVVFHNTGLYNLPGSSSYPANNGGLYEVTRDPRDVGKFKAPTLRNIAVTAPYMHDGSIPSLEEAIDHYAAGGRTIGDGPYRGVGRDNPNKSPTIRGFTLTNEQRADLVAFLKSLTDEALLRDPRFAERKN